MNEDKHYWEVSGIQARSGQKIYKISLVVSAQTQAEAEKRAISTGSFTEITGIKEIDTFTYTVAKVTALAKKTEHINTIYGVIIVSIIIIVFTTAAFLMLLWFRIV